MVTAAGARSPDREAEPPVSGHSPWGTVGGGRATGMRASGRFPCRMASAGGRGPPTWEPSRCRWLLPPHPRRTAHKPPGPKPRPPGSRDANARSSFNERPVFLHLQPQGEVSCRSAGLWGPIRPLGAGRLRVSRPPLPTRSSARGRPQRHTSQSRERPSSPRPRAARSGAPPGLPEAPRLHASTAVPPSGTQTRLPAGFTPLGPPGRVAPSTPPGGALAGGGGGRGSSRCEGGWLCRRAASVGPAPFPPPGGGHPSGPPRFPPPSTHAPPGSPTWTRPVV